MTTKFPYILVFLKKPKNFLAKDLLKSLKYLRWKQDFNFSFQMRKFLFNVVIFSRFIFLIYGRILSPFLSRYVHFKFLI